MRRRRMRYQPSRQSGIFGGVVGIIFVLIGVTIAIPTFGLFGVFWTLIALGITIHSFAVAAGKVSMGTYTIEEEGEEHKQPSSGSVEERLTQLQSLYDRRLISQEEYGKKRQEILREL